MPVKLTPQIVAKERATDQIRNLRDTLVPGLELRIFPPKDGKPCEKRWSVRYRVGRQQKRLTLGNAVTIPLGGKGGARELAEKALLQVANGRDPAEEKKGRREAQTVGEFAETYMERYAKVKKRSWKNDQAILKADVLPKWKHRAMQEIARRDVRELLDTINDRGAPIHANRVRALLSKLFAFGIKREIVDHNPVRDVEKVAKERLRDRFLTPDEIRVFWKKTEKMNKIVRAMWRIRLLTAQRPQEEIAYMHWGEVNLDSGWWTIPVERSKNGLAHRVPLSPPAVELLREIQPSEFEAEDFVFKGFTRDKQIRGASDFKIENFQPRDLRKTARTLLSEDGVPRESCEALLNHKKPGLVGVYDRHDYDREKRQAVEHLARRIDAIVNAKEGASVLPFAQRA
jgi:integrase